MTYLLLANTSIRIYRIVHLQRVCLPNISNVSIIFVFIRIKSALILIFKQLNERSGYFSIASYTPTESSETASQFRSE